MKTIRTAVATVLLLGILYGGYQLYTQGSIGGVSVSIHSLTQSSDRRPPEDAPKVDQWVPPDIEMGEMIEAPAAGASARSGGWGMPAGLGESPATIPAAPSARHGGRADSPAGSDWGTSAGIPPVPPMIAMPAAEGPPGGSSPAGRAELPDLVRSRDAGPTEIFNHTYDPSAERRASEPSNRSGWSQPHDGADAFSRGESPHSLAGGTASGVGREAFESAWRSAQALLERRRLDEALQVLSPWYGSPDLPDETHRQLVTLLDQLAGTVIYSRQHWIEPPYAVRRGETLQEIANRYEVPWQLLQKINGIEDHLSLLPGDELKVVRGPFEAQVDLATRELTLFVGGRYAGRFPVAVGAAADLPPAEMAFRVREKGVQRPVYDAYGREIPPGHPENPFGRYYLDLGSDIIIHGLADPSAAARGCIGVSSRDAEDLYSILSVGSTVVLRR